MTTTKAQDPIKRAWLNLNGQVSNLEHAVTQRDQYKVELDRERQVTARLRAQVGILKACVEGIANNRRDAIWQEDWFQMRDNCCLVLDEAARAAKG